MGTGPLARPLARSLTRSRAHGKEVFAHVMYSVSIYRAFQGSGDGRLSQSFRPRQLVEEYARSSLQLPVVEAQRDEGGRLRDLDEKGLGEHRYHWGLQWNF